MRLKKASNAATRETRAQAHNSRAFTLIELIVFTVTLAIVVLLLLPMLSRGSGCKATRNRCVNNLKNVGLAFRIYATDHNDRFPWETSGAFLSDPALYILMLTNELSSPTIVKCPEDVRTTISAGTNWTQFSRTNLSYFISPDASEILPQSFLAGDRNITNKNGTLRPGLRGLSRLDPAGWDDTIHKRQGNAAMGDGSVQQLSGARLTEQLRNTGHSSKYIKLSVP